MQYPGPPVYGTPQYLFSKGAGSLNFLYLYGGFPKLGYLVGSVDML